MYSQKKKGGERFFPFFFFIYLYLCSDQMHHHTLALIFSGLASSGVWGCFDEFNRISIEVLSVVATQVRTIFEAVRSRSRLFTLGSDVGEDGKLIYLPLRREVGIFITMNPGYKGRTELPANVKALFRPCAMVVPDVQQISEILLSAEGFVTARNLAIKFARCYTYAKQQLSAQMQYDWGLRAMRAVLLVAGNAKRAALSRIQNINNNNTSTTTTTKKSKSSSSATTTTGRTRSNSTTKKDRQQQQRSSSSPSSSRAAQASAAAAAQQQVLTLTPEQESLIFARALYTSNLAKLHVSDIALLKRLILALFPDVSAQALLQMGDIDGETQDLMSAVKGQAKRSILSLGEDNSFLRKITQLIDSMKVRHSIFIMGPALSGKTALWRLLSCAYSAVGRKPLIELIEPKTLSSNELYGFVHPQSHEWHDGILAKTFRGFANAAAASGGPASSSQPAGGGASSSSSGSNNNSNTAVNAEFIASLPKWIVMDGVIDPMWVETMNSVMDDNKLLTLPNNERISMTPSMRLVFEIGHLHNATPATVSRAGIILMNEGDVSWSAVKDRYIAIQADPTHRALLDALMEKHMSTALLFAQDNLPLEALLYTSSSSSSGGGSGSGSGSSSGGAIGRSRAIEWTRSICALFQGIIQLPEFRKCHPLPIEIVEPLFVYCIAHVLGSTMPHVQQAGHVGTNYDLRAQFSTAFRRQFPQLGKFGDSTSTSIFDFRPFIERFETLPAEGLGNLGGVTPLAWTPPAQKPTQTTTSSKNQQQKEDGDEDGNNNNASSSPPASPTRQELKEKQQQTNQKNSQQQQQQQQPQSEFLLFRFVRWENAASEQRFAMHPCSPWQQQLVPAPEALRTSFFIDVILSQPDMNVLLVGPTCSSKSLHARQYWQRATTFKCNFLETKDPFARTSTTTQIDDSSATASSSQIQQQQENNSVAGGGASSGKQQRAVAFAPNVADGGERRASSSFRRTTSGGGGSRSSFREKYSRPPEYMSANMRASLFSWSYTSTREQVQGELEQLLERRGPHTLGPIGNSHLVLVVDDINLPFVDEFGDSSASCLLRQIVTLKMLYDPERLQTKDIEDIRVLGTFDPAREGCGPVDERLAARFFPITLGAPHEDQCRFILHCMMMTHCGAAKMKYDLLNDLDRVTSLFIDIQWTLAATFGPTEAFPQHRFTFRDIIRAAEGLCRGLRPRTSSSTSLPAATLFHLTRAVSDRLGTSRNMFEVSTLIRERILSRFADNPGSADLHESGFALFIPPPCSASTENNSNDNKKSAGGGAASTAATGSGGNDRESKGGAAGDDEDPDKTKKPLLGSHTPYGCSSIDSASKAIGLDSTCVSTIVSIEGETGGANTAALNRVHNTYGEWSSSEFARIDSLGNLQATIEGGILSVAASMNMQQENNNSSSSSASGGGGGKAREREAAVENFVFFDAALVQIAACARILNTPGGHLLLLGLGGSGRRYILRLAAMYLGYEVIIADVASISDDSKDLAEWKSQISLWQKRAVLKDQKLCVTVMGCENATTGGNTIVANIHELVRHGVCFPSLTNEEKEEFASAVQSSRSTLPTHLQSPFVDSDVVPSPFEAESFIWDSFAIRSRHNLHFAIVMPLIPTQIRRLRRRFPAFTDECQILHSHPWQRSALENVCRRIFDKNHVVIPPQFLSADDDNNDSGDKNDENNNNQHSAEELSPESSLLLQQQQQQVEGEVVVNDGNNKRIKNKNENEKQHTFATQLTEEVAQNVTQLLARAHGLVVRQATLDAASSSSSSNNSSGNNSSGGGASSSSRRVIITPKHFLQSVNLFIKLLGRKNVDVSGQVSRLTDGLHQIDDCEEQVDNLKARLTIEREAVKIKATETSELLRSVEAEKRSVSDAHQLTTLEEERTTKLVEEVKKLVIECDREIEAALPAVDAARDALKTLNKTNLTELKSMSKPPSDVHAVAACVLCLVTPAGERLPRDRSWNAAKTKLMGDISRWLRDLVEFDGDNIPEQNVNAVRPTIADPTFNRAAISTKSFAAAGLCEWVINIVKYHDLHQLFIPKEKRLADARTRQEESETKLEKVRARLVEYEKKYIAVVERYEHAKSEQQRLQDSTERTESHLDRARRLVHSLGGERRRWAASRDALEKSSTRIAPEMALAATFFVYSGAFPFVGRRKLWDELVNAAIDVELVSELDQVESDAPVSTLFNEADLAHWSSCGLPTDSFSDIAFASVRVRSRVETSDSSSKMEAPAVDKLSNKWSSH